MRNTTLKSTTLARVCVAAFVLASTTVLVGCEQKAEAVTPEKIEQQYGVSGAYMDNVTTSDGAIRGTLVPVTLADGRKAHLFVPQQRRNEAHGVYLRDDQGLHPVHIKESATRDEVTSAPAVVEQRTEPEHRQKRSWEKDALIIGGTAGAGTAIGAIAGGKKGAYLPRMSQGAPCRPERTICKCSDSSAPPPSLGIRSRCGRCQSGIAAHG